MVLTLQFLPALLKQPAFADDCAMRRPGTRRHRMGRGIQSNGRGDENLSSLCHLV